MSFQIPLKQSTTVINIIYLICIVCTGREPKSRGHPWPLVFKSCDYWNMYYHFYPFIVCCFIPHLGCKITYLSVIDILWFLSLFKHLVNKLLINHCFLYNLIISSPISPLPLVKSIQVSLRTLNTTPEIFSSLPSWMSSFPYTELTRFLTNVILSKLFPVIAISLIPWLGWKFPKLKFSKWKIKLWIIEQWQSSEGADEIGTWQPILLHEV